MNIRTIVLDTPAFSQQDHFAVELGVRTIDERLLELLTNKASSLGWRTSMKKTPAGRVVRFEHHTGRSFEIEQSLLLKLTIFGETGIDQTLKLLSSDFATMGVSRYVGALRQYTENHPVQHWIGNLLTAINSGDMEAVSAARDLVQEKLVAITKHLQLTQKQRREFIGSN